MGGVGLRGGRGLGCSCGCGLGGKEREAVGAACARLGTAGKGDCDGRDRAIFNAIWIWISEQERVESCDKMGFVRPKWSATEVVTDTITRFP